MTMVAKTDVQEALLKVDDLEVRFGGLVAVNRLSFQVRRGEVLSLIGPNGAGKTTVAGVLTGFVPPTAGTVWFDGSDITGRRPEEIARRGAVRTFQKTSIFGGATCEENVAAGCFVHTRASLWQVLFNTRGFQTEERAVYQRAREVLRLVGLWHRSSTPASSLAYGEQRLLGVAIALGTEPKLVALDEPAAGLNPEEAEIMAKLIRRLCDLGITVLLIEHNMSIVMAVSDHIVVIDHGEKIAEGKPADIQSHPEVIRAYLGVEL